jgi:hypothetical protein
MRRYILFSLLCISVLFVGSVMTVHSSAPHSPTSSPAIYLSSGTENRYVVFESFLRPG